MLRSIVGWVRMSGEDWSETMRRMNHRISVDRTTCQTPISICCQSCSRAILGIEGWPCPYGIVVVVFHFDSGGRKAKKKGGFRWLAILTHAAAISFAVSLLLEDFCPHHNLERDYPPFTHLVSHICPPSQGAASQPGRGRPGVAFSLP